MTPGNGPEERELLEMPRRLVNVLMAEPQASEPHRILDETSLGRDGD